MPTTVLSADLRVITRIASETIGVPGAAVHLADGDRPAPAVAHGDVGGDHVLVLPLLIGGGRTGTLRLYQDRPFRSGPELRGLLERVAVEVGRLVALGAAPDDPFFDTMALVSRALRRGV